MKRNNAEQIGVLIRNFLRQESLESPLNEQRLINAWEEVLGSAVASYTRQLYIKNQVLYVHLTSAALRQELMMGPSIAGAQSEPSCRGTSHHQYHIPIKPAIKSVNGIHFCHSENEDADGKPHLREGNSCLQPCKVMISSMRTSNGSAGTSSTSW